MGFFSGNFIFHFLLWCGTKASPRSAQLQMPGMQRLKRWLLGKLWLHFSWLAGEFTEGSECRCTWDHPEVGTQFSSRKYTSHRRVPESLARQFDWSRLLLSYLIVSVYIPSIYSNDYLSRPSWVLAIFLSPPVLKLLKIGLVVLFSLSKGSLLPEG